MYILYGEEYVKTIPVLRILVWYLAASVMGAVRNVWILAEQKQQYLWGINLAGALTNIGINAILIPVWGARGAAVASLITQIFANLILGFIMEPLRENNVLLLRGMHPRFLKEEMRNILILIKKRSI